MSLGFVLLFHGACCCLARLTAMRQLTSCFCRGSQMIFLCVLAAQELDNLLEVTDKTQADGDSFLPSLPPDLENLLSVGAPSRRVTNCCFDTSPGPCTFHSSGLTWEVLTLINLLWKNPTLAGFY
ncbi:UNVERIFIED_CONTAM: hypothetical protein K2H54_035353 [Gekko kuhli]